MQNLIVAPFAITYDGNDADQHIISATALGQSIIGASKLYTATVHYCMFGAIPRGNYKKTFETFALPAREKCFEYHILVAAIASEYTLHGDIYKHGLKFLFSHVLKAIKDIWLKPGDTAKMTEQLFKYLELEKEKSSELNLVLANGLIRSNDNFASLHGKLIDSLPEIADATRAAGAQFVTPVGNTCKQITQFSEAQEKIIITEPEAEVIRGGNKMEIEDMRKFNCTKISEVNIVSGHCILAVEGFDGPIVGKISDPALKMPNNIYTKALNNQTGFEFSAKPVKKDGIIHRLYVSDAMDAPR